MQCTLDRASSGKGAVALIEAMRPTHWIKNAFVAAPILFAQRFDEPAALWRCLTVVAGFCLLSSSTYLLNDVCDRDNDRKHPEKASRPVASGRLSVKAALMAAGLLAAAGFALMILVSAVARDATSPLHGLDLLAWTATYVILNLLYSFRLKHHAIVDVIIIALGFVMRAMAGAAAIAAPHQPVACGVHIHSVPLYRTGKTSQ